MKHTICLGLLALSTHSSNAQWELHIAAGTSAGKLLPKEMSTPANSRLSYGIVGKGSCFSPEVALKVNDNTRFTFGYQLSFTPSGIQFRPEGRGGPRQSSTDVVCLHSAVLGYAYKAKLAKAGIHIGGFAKAGIAYGSMSALKEGGGSGHGENGNGYFMSGRRLTEFEVMPNFWTPVSSIGFSIGPDVKNSRLADRLSFTASATMMWNDPYTSYSKAEYYYVSGARVLSQPVQFRGNSMLFQFCADYNLFRFQSKAKKQ